MVERRLIYGVGINDVPGGSGPGGRDPVYVAWTGMIMRCYCPRYLARYPSYKKCSVADEWLTFSAFKRWMLSQNWRGMVLDKDLLVPGNKVYSSSTCAFIPGWVNNFLSNLVPKNRDLPMGVSRSRNKFSCRYGCRGSAVHIGLFDTAEQAHVAYKRYRLNEIKIRIARYCEDTSANSAVAEALQRLYANEASEVDGLKSFLCGDPPSRAKVSNIQVLEIRTAFLVDGVSRSALASKYNLSRRAMDRLITGESWKV